MCAEWAKGFDPALLLTGLTKHVTVTAEGGLSWSAPEYDDYITVLRTALLTAMAAGGANRRAFERDVSGSLTADHVLAAWGASGYRCAVCEKDLSKKDGDLTLDHRHPLEFGGPNAPENLRAACKSCNSKEYWKWWREHGKRRAA